MSNLIAANIPGTSIRILWCTCTGLRTMLLDIRSAQWVCLHCGASADYARVWGL